MAKTAIHQRAAKLMQFLLALNDNRIASALVARGFGDDDLEQAFRILRSLVRPNMANVPKWTDKQLSEQLVAFYGEACATIGATLRHRAPEAHERLSINLAPFAEMGTLFLLDRLDQLAEPPPVGLGAAGEEALSLLARRGLTPEKRQMARELCELTFNLDPERDVPPCDIDKAAEDLVRFYGEWSQIGRSAVTDPNLQRKLGVRREGKE